MSQPLTVAEPPPTTRAGRRILDAADALFYARGITAVGVDLLAETAGTTKRTLYQRFGSKEGLVVAYLQHRAHDWQQGLLDRLAERAAGARRRALDAGGAPDPVGSVLLVLGAAAERAGDARRGCAFVNAWAELGPAHQGASQVIAAEKEWMRALFQRLVGDEALARQIHLVYEGAQVTAAVTGDAAAFDVAADAVRTLIQTSRADRSRTPPVRADG